MNGQNVNGYEKKIKHERLKWKFWNIKGQSKNGSKT